MASDGHSSSQKTKQASSQKTKQAYNRKAIMPV